MSDVIFGKGWAPAAVNLSAAFRAAHGRDPNATEAKVLAVYRDNGAAASRASAAQGGSENEERNFWTAYGLAEHYIETGIRAENPSTPLGHQTAAPGQFAAFTQIIDRSNAHIPKKGGFFSKIGHAVTSAVNVAAKYNAIASQVNLVKNIASGKNVAASAKQLAADNISALRAGAAMAPGANKYLPAIDAAISVGKGASVKNVALAAARRGIPANVTRVFDAGAGIAKGNLPPSAVEAVKAMIATTPQAKAAFDAGHALTSGAGQTALNQMIASQTHPAASQILAKAALTHAAVTAHAPSMLAPPSRAKKKVPRALSPRAKAFIMKRAIRRGTNALKNENTYVVENNDSAFRIAQNLTGSPTAPIAPSKLPPWKELLIANRQKTINDGYNKIRVLKPGEIPTNAMNFSFLKTGEELHVPQNWIDAAKAQAAKKLGIGTPAARPAAPAPAGAPATVIAIPGPGAEPVALPPSAALPKPGVIVNPGASKSEKDDAQAIAQAKLILAAWGGTDGAGSSTLSDYGTNADDASPLWGSRDNLELLSFVNWANKHGSKLDAAGDLTQAKLDALVAWSEAKSKAVAVSTPPPPVNITAPVPMQKPAEPSPKPEPDLPGPPAEPPSAMNGSAAPAPVTPPAAVSQAGMGGDINLPETLIAGQPKSNNDLLLLAGVAALALFASSGKKTRGRRAA